MQNAREKGKLSNHKKESGNQKENLFVSEWGQRGPEYCKNGGVKKREVSPRAKHTKHGRRRGNKERRPTIGERIPVCSPLFGRPAFWFGR